MVRQWSCCCVPPDMIVGGHPLWPVRRTIGYMPIEIIKIICMKWIFVCRGKCRDVEAQYIGACGPNT